MTHQAWLWTEH
uniref:Uncharacterized protein n=1 Tax=Anguilla anguilla TaxID=7936 RepID=A0A0E9T3E1_ANGAN